MRKFRRELLNIILPFPIILNHMTYGLLRPVYYRRRAITLKTLYYIEEFMVAMQVLYKDR